MSLYGSPQYSLAAGSGQDIVKKGNYVRFFSSDGVEDLEIGFDNSTPEPLPVGVGVHVPAGFDRVRVHNPNAAAVVFQIAIADGEISDDRLTLTAGAPMPVRGGGGSMTDTETIVSNVAVQLLAADASRTAAVIRAGAADLWLGPDNTVVAGAVATVPAGQSLSVAHTGAVWAIRAGAGTLKAGVYKEAV